MSFNKYIDIEATKNARVLSDIDNFRFKYIDVDSSNNITVIYPGFKIQTVEDNLFLILKNSSKVDFNSKWVQRPDYVSYEYYGTVIYWWLILYINEIDSIEDFEDLPEVIVPSIDIIRELVDSRVPPDEFEKDEVVDYDVRTKYYRRYPTDNIEAATLQSEEDLEETYTPPTPVCIVREQTDEIILTASDISNEYVDLTYEVMNYSSIVLKIEGYTTTQSYGYDYVLIYLPNTTTRQRISWSDSDCSLGNGMEHLLEVGDKLIITYAYAAEGCEPCSVDYECVDGGVY